MFLLVNPLRVESEIHDDVIFTTLSADDLAALSASSCWARSPCPATQWMFEVPSLLLRVQSTNDVGALAT